MIVFRPAVGIVASVLGDWLKSSEVA